MIVDERIWDYVVQRYDVIVAIERHSIVVNEDTDEYIVEVYLKSILVYPIPNKELFNFKVPK